MPPGLNETTQADWSGGMCRAVARHLIPNDAAYDIRDGLLDDDGDVYQRGPTTRLTSNQLGVGLAALFEGQFTAGRRLLGLDAAGANYGVVNAAGNAWIGLGNAGAVSGGGLAAQLGDLMFLATSAGLMFYAGSLRPLPGYNVGTVTVAAGSAIVTGAGTGWVAAGVDVGSIIRLTGQTNVLAVVKSVDSATQITLTAPWNGATAAAVNYALQPAFVYAAGTTPAISSPTAVAAVSGRLLYATGRKVIMSNSIDQNTGQSRPLIFDVDDFHEFPADVVGLANLRDVVYVFTKAGIWSISNAGLPIVDAFGNPQHRVQRVSGDVVLRSAGGLTPWRDSLVVCAVGGVYVMDSSGGLELVSRSITPLWQSLMASGQLVWQTMAFRDHVFVPIGGQLLVGRLDRRTKTPVGASAPWTRFSQGEASVVAAMAVQDPFGSPKLVGGAPSVSGFLVNLTGVFGTGALPAAAGGVADANAAPYGMVVETREYLLDAGGLATVRDVAMEYESTDGAISALAAVGQRAAPNADPTYAALASSAAGNFATQNPRVLAVRREARRISYQFASSGGVTGWRLRAVRTRTRLRGRRR